MYSLATAMLRCIWLVANPLNFVCWEFTSSSSVCFVDMIVGGCWLLDIVANLLILVKHQ